MTTLHSDSFMPASPIKPLVLVGVCASGKTTVSAALKAHGISAHPVAQEHSRVPGLYRRSDGLVVVLGATWETVHRRRKLSWNPAFYHEEWDRIREARRDAALIIHTDWLGASDVAARITGWFDRWFGFDGLWVAVDDPDERCRIRTQFQP